ncbi:A24 family peptidase [Vibrio sp. THAF190c]|uniref:prepilin peptidase n=1 Tax=Vibrio sp. THAF190c TaxID=2587865 RepID=UPI001267F7D2|nr:A24 family peptidase [Vibrio sp. THAF190c]QFT13301.1 Type 4 prepilin-like proteins leader peptide-processing enzyme [Vibrio sp. THAF190c]
MNQLINTILDTRDVIFFVLNDHLYRTISLTIIGSVVGSFLTVVVHRLPLMIKERVVCDLADFYPELLVERDFAEYIKGTNLGGFSVAPCCNTLIKAKHNVPILSWILLKGRCAYCGVKISPRYVGLELLTAVVFGITSFVSPSKEAALIGVGISAVLIAIAFIDLEEWLIPDELNLFAIGFSLLAINYSIIDSSIANAFCAAITTYLGLSLINITCNKLIDKPALGGGDIKLMAAMAMLLGVINSLAIVAISILTMMFFTYFTQKKAEGYYPLGPYLAVLVWVKVVYML